MNEKIDRPEWCVVVVLDYANQTYTVDRMYELPPLSSRSTLSSSRYILVEADDEIGAFNAAQKVMKRLGFSQVTTA